MQITENIQILADNLDDGWLSHIRGCAQLIQIRGPSRHLAEFDRQLLFAQEGLIVSSSQNLKDDTEALPRQVTLS